MRKLGMLARVLGAFLLALLPLAGQAAPSRIALVIGNGDYRQAPLANPVNDARLMARTLGAVGFEVALVTDADQKGMKRAILDFGDRLERAGRDAVGLFFFAGHGLQVNGENFLVPMNAAIRREKDVEVEAVSANWVLVQMEFAGNRMNLVILDACRNNPYARSFRSASRGLARMDAPRGSLVAYSTAPGDVAADGTGANSPYARALSRAIRVPGVPVEQVFKSVRLSVMEETGEAQVPWEASSLTGDFYFNPGDRELAEKPPSRPEASAQGEGATEIVFWQSIKESSDPADFEAYLESFGEDATFAALARNRLAALASRQAALTPPAEIAAPAPSTEEPLLDLARRLLEEFAEDAGAIAGSSELSLGERLRKFRGLLVYVLDFEVMARFVLGRHRQTATLDQWDTFLSLYKELFLTGYSFTSVDAWSGAIDIQGVIRYGDDILVQFVLKSPGSADLRLDFRVRKKKQGFGIKIIDVLLEGVSLLQTQRADFSTVLRERGLDGLNQVLALKVAKAADAGSAQ